MEYKAYREDSLDLNQKSPFFWDHVVRYWWASEMAQDKSVLDCATGKGYGAFILSHHAKKVVGIDLNDNSLKIASESFLGINHLIYKKQDIFTLSNLGEKFDLITAFEVIEHIPHERTVEFLKSLYEALNPGGVLLISTPNHDVVLKSGVHVPVFHINNFKAQDLKSYLEKTFDEVQMLGQFRKRKGIAAMLFDLDFFNLRHVLKNLFNSNHKKLTTESIENSDDHELMSGQKLSSADFMTRPSTEIDSYLFSKAHYRQAGLSVAICRKKLEIV
jgi:2-polyprenyl-3-methyl-5-hydroxy-6-metoxy-1,4-benzoquinol methylase